MEILIKGIDLREVKEYDGLNVCRIHYEVAGRGLFAQTILWSPITLAKFGELIKEMLYFIEEYPEGEQQ